MSLSRSLFTGHHGWCASTVVLQTVDTAIPGKYIDVGQTGQVGLKSTHRSTRTEHGEWDFQL